MATAMRHQTIFFPVHQVKIEIKSLFRKTQITPPYFYVSSPLEHLSSKLGELDRGKISSTNLSNVISSKYLFCTGSKQRFNDF